MYVSVVPLSNSIESGFEIGLNPNSIFLRVIYLILFVFASLLNRIVRVIVVNII